MKFRNKKPWKILKDDSCVKYRTGRPSTDLVTNIRGQMNTCVACGLEYSMEEAMEKRWPLFEGHCEKCAIEKNL